MEEKVWCLDRYSFYHTESSKILPAEKYLYKRVSERYRGDKSWQDHTNARIAKVQNHPGKGTANWLKGEYA
jgi:hypothetical protein